MKRPVTKTIKFHADLVGIQSQVRKSPTTSSVAADTPKAAAVVASPESQSSAALRGILDGIYEQMDTLESARAQNLRELQEVGIELGVLIASHIVKEKLDANELDLSELVMAAIDKLLPCDRLVIKLHPSDLGPVQHYVEQELKEDSERFELQEDATLPRGSCFVAGNGHGLLSTLDGRLDDIRETLLQGIEHARIERRKADGLGKSLRRFPNRRQRA